MESFGTSPDRKYLCQEQNTGKGYSGFFYFDKKAIETEICSYDESFYIDGNNGPIFLRLDNNSIVSLHSNVTTIPGKHWSKESNVVYKQRIISNTAVIGRTKWEQNESVKRVQFILKHAENILNRPSQKNAFNTSEISEDDFHIFTEIVNGLTIRAHYSPSYTMGFDAPTNIATYITIDFSEGSNLSEYLGQVINLANFFSFCLGVRMLPSDIRIYRVGYEEMLKAAESAEEVEEFFVKYIWPEHDTKQTDTWLGGSLVMAQSDEELSVLKDCLSVWVKRYSDWKMANAQMVKCLELEDEISSDRLLAAYKWFEQIPLTKEQKLIADEHIEIIARQTVQAARDLGYQDLGSRVEGAIKGIRAESNKQRFCRLIDKIKQRFGYNFIDDSMIDSLVKIREFRGKSAHGVFIPDSKMEFTTFAKSIYALEKLCFLLTVHDLPVSEKSISRSKNHPMVYHYDRS